MEPELSDARRNDLETQGYFEVETPYGPRPQYFYQKLFDDGRLFSVLDQALFIPIALSILFKAQKTQMCRWPMRNICWTTSPLIM